jgi:hypothetical protein
VLSDQKQQELRELAAKLCSQYDCFSAPKGVKEKKGLGDVIAAMTNAVGIKPCKGCKRRQAFLNKIRW